jgi:hypothetical protein
MQGLLELWLEEIGERVKTQLTPLRLEFESSELIQPLLFPLSSFLPKKMGGKRFWVYLRLRSRTAIAATTTIRTTAAMPT